MKRIPVIIDCDPGVDDAIALILANVESRLDIRAVTTVSGNVELEHTTCNARKICSFIDLQVPLACGADRPLIKERITASKTHGEDGFGGCRYLIEHCEDATLADMNALELMRQVLEASHEKITLIALGPLTNLALLLLAYPHLKTKIEQISLMGGGLGVGNITKHAEFNFYVDPEAAHIVFSSGIPIIMAGLNATLQMQITEDMLRRLERIRNRTAYVGSIIMGAYQKKDRALHDPVAIYALIHPHLFTFEKRTICIETDEGEKRGMSIGDAGSGMHKVQVLTGLHHSELIETILESFNKYSRFEQV